MQIFGDDYPTPDGTCVRDYIHVTDLADAHLRALAAARPGEHRVYNLGNGAGFCSPIRLARPGASHTPSGSPPNRSRKSETAFTGAIAPG